MCWVWKINVDRSFGIFPPLSYCSHLSLYNLSECVVFRNRFQMLVAAVFFLFENGFDSATFNPSVKGWLWKNILSIDVVTTFILQLKKKLCINNSSKQRMQSKGPKLLFGKLVILLPQKNNSS